VHRDFAIHANANPIPVNAPGVEYFKRQFGFEKFGMVFGFDLGFEHSLKFLGMNRDFFEYHIPTPVCRKQGGPCQGCGGSGKDEFHYDGTCFNCDGKGKSVYYDYKEANAILASLTLLFETLQFPEIVTSSKQFQLISVFVGVDLNRVGIGGEFSAEVVYYLSRSMGDVPAMVTAMKAAHTKMEGEMKEFYLSSFRASVDDRNGWLNVSCPGQACGINPSHVSRFGTNEGYEFSDHNVDQPIQLLTLLSSLAALHDLVR